MKYYVCKTNIHNDVLSKYMYLDVYLVDTDFRQPPDILLHTNGQDSNKRYLFITTEADVYLHLIADYMYSTYDSIGLHFTSSVVDAIILKTKINIRNKLI